jgi:hypothetical protein
VSACLRCILHGRAWIGARRRCWSSARKHSALATGGGRRTGDEEAVVGAEGAHHLGEQRVFVLDAVRLVDDDVAPVELLEVVLLLDHHLVRGDHHVELAGLQHALALRVPLLAGAVELDGLDDGAPAPELGQPVVQRGLGHDHHVGARDAAELAQVGQQRDGLQRLAQPHLVGQDAVDPVVVQVDEPVEALQLVLAHLAVRDDGGLRLQPVAHHLPAAALLVAQQLLVLLLLAVPAVPPALLLAVGGGRGVGRRKVLEDVGLLEEELQALLAARGLRRRRGRGQSQAARPARGGGARVARGRRDRATARPARRRQPGQGGDRRTSPAAASVLSVSRILASCSLRSLSCSLSRSRSLRATSRAASVSSACGGAGA